MSELKTTLELAKEHMNERHRGSCKKSNVTKLERNQNVNCIMCHRDMTAPKFEKPPYYCYKCDQEASGVFGNG